MTWNRTAGGRQGWITIVSATALLLVPAGCGGDTDGGDGRPDPTPSASTSTPAPTTRDAVVYFLTDTRTGFRLAREQRRVTGDDLAVAAVETMIAGPVDHDYASTWNRATRVLSVELVDGVVVVDLSREARIADAGSEAVARMVQQLVYTATEAVDRTASVRLLIEGQPAGELWGVLEWSDPVPRERPVDVRLLVQIDTPTEGAVVDSPVEVTGDAAAFEANVPWRVLDTSGVVAAQGFATTAAGQRFAPFSFSVDLAPGTYVIEISEDDPSDGEGGTPMRDTRTVTVR